MSKRNKAIGRQVGRIRLFPAVLFALCGGLAVAYVAYQVLHKITPSSDVKAAPIDITRVALTIVAGVGGVVALVIAYRRQRDLEQSRFIERFGAAAAQLAATDVALRIAGVYAMAGVADESDGLRRQQCIDVLCGYLRLPYDAEHGGSGRTKLVVKAPRVDRGRVRGETEEHIEYRHNDREVRATIIRVIANHLRPEAEYSWSANEFDFRTAYLEDVDFDGVTFSGAVRFDGVTFSGAASFDDATFGGTASFGKAVFSGDAAFSKAVFSGTASFSDATFSGAAWFGLAVFSRDVWFSSATFGGIASFGVATFRDTTSFTGAAFADAASFGSTTFGRTLWFSDATFSRDASFSKATFDGDAWFDTTTFVRNAAFGGATFRRDTSFARATFGCDADFSEAAFRRAAGFDKVAFAGRASFVAADFGSARAFFTEPRQWGPPSPEFDWGEDGAGKPPNVEPQDWPPVVAS